MTGNSVQQSVSLPAAVWSIPDALADRRRTLGDRQAPQKQVPNRECDDKFDGITLVSSDGDDTVAVLLGDCVDGSGRPTIDVVSRLPGVKAVVRHTACQVVVGVYFVFERRVRSQGSELSQYFKYNKPLYQTNYRQIAPDSG